jgi:hypothetical protein
MGKKFFPLDLFLKLLKEQPVCYLYSLATAGVLSIPIYILYKLYMDSQNERKFWLWRFKEEKKIKNGTPFERQKYMTLLEEIEKKKKELENLNG